MNSIVGLSTLLAAAVIAIEFTMLRAITQEALSLRKKLRPPQQDGASKSALGMRIKPFRARVLGAPIDFTEIDPRGKTTFLLFVEPGVAAPLGERAVGAVLHALQRRYESASFLVCCGQLDQCRHFCKQYGLSAEHDVRFRILLDEDRALMNQFSVHVCPTGIVIDETGRVAKIGGIEGG